jgi:MoaA/NifB/PqqE/SkfB family radical SAM enzyme
MPGEMTREQIFTALREFVEMGTRKVNLDGGDPLTHKHVDEIVQWLTDQGISTRMNTNGILIPKKIAIIKRLVTGALAAREAGVPRVEFTCVVGRHNADRLDALIEVVETLGLTVIFQPARNSLFLDTDRDGAAWQADSAAHRTAFAWLAQQKRTSKAIANEWSSLRHFRTFPEDTKIPCAAGWLAATLDPEGNLYHCGQVNRTDRSNNVVRLGARTAFERLRREGCSQCWCARTVEGNYKWGGRIDMMLPPRRKP